MDLREEGALSDECKKFISEEGGPKGLLDCSSSIIKNCASADHRVMATGQCLTDSTVRERIGDQCVNIAYGMGAKLDLGLHNPNGVVTIEWPLYWPEEIPLVAQLFMIWAVLISGAYIYKCRSVAPLATRSKSRRPSSRGEDTGVVLLAAPAQEVL